MLKNYFLTVHDVYISLDGVGYLAAEQIVAITIVCCLLSVVCSLIGYDAGYVILFAVLESENEGLDIGAASAQLKVCALCVEISAVIRIVQSVIITQEEGVIDIVVCEDLLGIRALDGDVVGSYITKTALYYNLVEHRFIDIVAACPLNNVGFASLQFIDFVAKSES